MPEFVELHFVGLSVRDAVASAAWYERVLGLVRGQEAGPSGQHRGAAILEHRASGLLVGLIALRANAGEPFDEARTGLDHLEFRVADRAELEAWAAHLDALGVVRSPIAERPSADILTFRDPGNIQVELYAPKEPVSRASEQPGTKGP